MADGKRLRHFVRSASGNNNRQRKKVYYLIGNGIVRGKNILDMITDMPLIFIDNLAHKQNMSVKDVQQYLKKRGIVLTLAEVMTNTSDDRPKAFSSLNPVPACPRRWFKLIPKCVSIGPGLSCDAL